MLVIFGLLNPDSGSTDLTESGSDPLIEFQKVLTPSLEAGHTIIPTCKELTPLFFKAEAEKRAVINIKFQKFEGGKGVGKKM